MSNVLPGTLIERTFRERIILVGVIFPGLTDEMVAEELDELAAVGGQRGRDVVGRVVQTPERTPDAATFVGRGKAEEIAELSRTLDADTVVFDDELTPAQHRNLEKLFGRTAIDRTAVILDIFAQNARSPEGKAQVELALLRYRLPRLRGRGTALSQQAGGIVDPGSGGDTARGRPPTARPAHAQAGSGAARGRAHPDPAAPESRQGASS